MARKFAVMSLQEAGVSLIDCVHKTPSEDSNGTFKYIAIPQMKNCRIDDRDARRISEKDFKEWTKKALPKTNDVILSRRCNPGETAYVPKDVNWALGQNLVLLRSDGTKVFPPYLRWMVRSEEWWEQVRKFINVGAIFDSLKCADVPNFQITIPPLETQEKIASILDAFENKIELNNQTNETLESMAKAIFKEWFIDFGPVKANAEGRKPFGMDDETAALFPDSFEESELGQIPKGWSSGKLDEIAEVVGGGTPSTSESSYYCQPSTGISWLSPKDLSGYSWKYISHGATDITESGLKNSSARMLPQGAVLFSSRAPIGYVAIAEKELSTNQGFKSLVPKNGANTEFLYYLAKANVELIESRASGSTFKEISGNGMKELPVVLPSKQILEAFKNIVSEFSKLQRELKHETDILIKTRDLLLPKLISGEIELKELQ